MHNEQYYRLILDDVSAPSFTSFGKPYFGTLREISDFIVALESDSTTSEQEKHLIQAFSAYEQGKTGVTHIAAYQEVPLLTPVNVIHEEQHSFSDYSWIHYNTWDCPYSMRCSKVETRHLWLQTEDFYGRVMYANFADLEYQGDENHRITIGDMLWGYPEMLHYAPPNIYNRLAESERIFKTQSELEADWAAFCAQPDPDFSEFCNDIFGDG